MNVNQILYKTIGFFNYKKSDVKEIVNNLSEYTLKKEDTQFLNQSYHTEYLNIMYNYS